MIESDENITESSHAIPASDTPADENPDSGADVQSSSPTSTPSESQETLPKWKLWMQVANLCL